jgi:general secretion pathway protein M
MSVTSIFAQIRDQASLYWLARTEQERKFLSIGGAVAFAALVYALFIGPALDGRAELRKALPELRLQAATMQALALEASELAARPAPQVTPMTKESLTASLAARSITPTQPVAITGEFAKLQLNGVAFANLYSWLEAQRRENRITASDIALTAGTPVGNVDAVVTLRQNLGDGAR